MERKLATAILATLMITIFSQNIRPSSNPLDSLLHEINKEGITFNERYSHLAHTYMFSPDDQISILQAVLKFAHNEEDKGGVVSIHNILSSVYTHIKNFEDAQLHSDSAILFKDKTTNIRALGGVYYQRSLLQSSKGGDRQQAIDDLYTAISYYEQFPEGAFPIVVMLKEIVKYYVEFDDLESIRTVMLDMLDRSKKINHPDAYIYTYPVFAQYYSMMYEKSNNAMYRDSIMMYSDSIINTYSALADESKASNTLQMGTTYLSYAQAILNSDSINWSKIEEYIGYANNLIPDIFYIEKLNLHILNSYLAIHKKDYLQAIKEALSAEELLDKDSQKSLTKSLVVYDAIIQAYEAAGNYKVALDYVHKQRDVENTMRTKEQYETAKELDVKYRTTMKDLEISQLNKEKQEARFHTTLIVAIATLLIILFLIALLYNRIKRLKKEKEALLLTERIDQKELEYITLLNNTEQRMIRRYLDGRESERKSLSRELHDSVANDIVSIIMLNDTTGDQLKISALLKDTYNHIRQISHQLMPPEFKYISLIGMIEDYIELLNDTTQCHFQVEIADPNVLLTIDEMTEELAKEIYYILQEVLGNIVKHADATTVKIKLSQSNNQPLVLSIVDDGKGFDTQKNYKGIGLRTIKDRCSDIEAELKMKSVIGKGTKIAITLYSESLAPSHQC